MSKLQFKFIPQFYLQFLNFLINKKGNRIVNQRQDWQVQKNRQF